MDRRWPGVESEAGPEAGKEEARPWKGSSPVIRPLLLSSPRLAARTPCELLRGEGCAGWGWGVSGEEVTGVTVFVCADPGSRV